MSQNPVILVTGAAGGIGEAIVRALLEETLASVVATDLVEGSLPVLSIQYPGRIEIRTGNIVDPDTSKEIVGLAIQRFGKLTGVCLNAGVFGPCYLLEDSPVDKWSNAFGINVLSHLHTLKYALPELRKHEGKVVSTTSGAGQAPLFSRWGFYGMSKAAVAFLIKQLHLEEPNIVAVGICPGLCDTKMIDGLLQGTHDGWSEEDVGKFRDFATKVTMITPAQAGHVYAQVVTKGDRSISGLILDYDDPRLPISEHLKRKEEVNYDYTKYSVETAGVK